MQTRTVVTYKYDELSDDAKTKAYEWWESGINDDWIAWQNENGESVEATISNAGLTLRDYSIDPYGYSTLEVAPFDGEDLTGARAYAWLENNLLAPVRVPWQGHIHRKYHYDKPGAVKSGPFTGYYLDDVCIAAVLDAIGAGYTLRDAFQSLAHTWARATRDVIEQEHSREYFEDTFAYEQEYLEDGTTWERR